MCETELLDANPLLSIDFSVVVDFCDRFVQMLRLKGADANTNKDFVRRENRSTTAARTKQEV